MSRFTVSLIGAALLSGALIVASTGVAHATRTSWLAVDNDECAAATPIGDGTFTGTTTGATPDGADSCGGTGSPDVWFLYTATCDGLVHISTCGSAYDTIVSVHPPGCDGTEETCEDIWQGGVICERFQVPVSTGEQKLIRLTGFDGENGDLNLRTICRPAPENDTCADATPLEVPSTTSGWTIGGEGDYRQVFGKVCRRADQSTWSQFNTPGVWYTVVGTGNRMTATTCAPEATMDSAIGVYCAGCDEPICAGFNQDAPTPLDPECEIPVELGFNYASRVSWCSRAGQEYRLHVFSWGPSDVFELTVEDTGEPCWDAADCTPVDVVNPILTDNGDDDGWADTLETVSMRFTVFNRSDVDVSGMQARISTDDPNVACIANPVVPIGDVAAGESKLSPGAFTFRVADVDRGDSLADFAARFDVSLSADQFADLETPQCSVGGEACANDDDCTNDDYCEERRCSGSGEPCYYSRNCAAGGCQGTCSRTGRSCWDSELHREGLSSYMGCDGEDYCVDESQEIRVQLDLDASDGSGRTMFFESFESGDFGAFTPMNLDAGLASPEAADGYRCQSHNPDAPNSSTVNLENCHPAIDAVHADAFYWQVDGGRAFSGSRSLYMGYEVEPGVYTTPNGALEAVRTLDPINLDWGRRCSVSGTACTGRRDCPGEQCLGAVPELSLKHQVNLLDWSSTSVPPTFSFSRGVLQVQVVDGDGNPLGNWTRIEPYQNVYDSQDSTNFIPCSFDPIDDGNTEDDFFDLEDPARRFGPSSTCFPLFTFSRIGESREPFAPENIGAASDGPGLQGETGLGTWVESKFSLEAFRGQRIRLRLLHTGVKQAADPPFETWPLFNTEGWWIDDVTVTNTLVVPATVAVDEKDNSALGIDEDNDCFGDVTDCDPTDNSIWAIPGEVIGLRLSHSGGMGGTTTLAWLGPTTPGGTVVNYTTVRTGPGTCEESSMGSATSATDTDTPAPGALHQFLVGAANGCGAGSLGLDSAHNPRAGCP